MPLRVLHLYAGNLYGGIERMLATIARERDACPEMEPEFGLCFQGRLSQELRECGAAVHDLGAVRFSRPWSVVGARRRLRELLRRRSFDVAICHSNWPHALFGAVCKAEGDSTVYWAHDVPTGRHWTERLARRSLPQMAIANSTFTALQLGKLFPSVPSAVVPPPVPDMALRVARHDRAALRRAHEVAPDEILIAHASRLDQAKGHEVLIEAMARLPANLRWRCLISAVPQRPQDHDRLRALEQLVQSRGLAQRAKLLRELPDVSTLFAMADVYCQPNLRPEGFGLTFVEAMYCGIPVVTSNVGGGAEVVDASCGILTQAGDVAAVASALEQLVRDDPLRAGLGANGRQRASQLCNPPTVLRRLHEVLFNVANRFPKAEAMPVAAGAVGA
jgi:glycosyltransferase involved in cell wall biosynthesis